MAKSKDRVETIYNMIGHVCLFTAGACLLAIPIIYELWLIGYIN